MHWAGEGSNPNTIHSGRAGRFGGRIPPPFPGWRMCYPKTSRPVLGPTQPPTQWVGEYFLRGKSEEAWRWPTSSITHRAVECSCTHFITLIVVSPTDRYCYMCCGTAEQVNMWYCSALVCGMSVCVCVCVVCVCVVCVCVVWCVCGVCGLCVCCVCV